MLSSTRKRSKESEERMLLVILGEMQRYLAPFVISLPVLLPIFCNCADNTVGSVWLN